MPGGYQMTLPRRLITERDWHWWLAGDESTQIDYGCEAESLECCS